MPLAAVPTQKSKGNKVICVMTTPPANPLAPTLAELNAGKFLTCHFYGDVLVTYDQNMGNAPDKVCTKISYQQGGNVTYTVADVTYSFMPQSQGTPGAPGNEALEALEPDTSVYVAVALGLDGEETTAFAEDDVIQQFAQLDCLSRTPGQTGDDEFAEFQMTQKFAVHTGTTVVEPYVVPAAA